MKKRKIFCIIILICFSLFGCIKKEVKDLPDFEFKLKNNYYAGEVNNETNAMYVIYLNNEKFSNDLVIPNKYAIDTDILKEFWRVLFDENGEPLRDEEWNTEIKRFNVDIYDIKTNEKIKTIDVKNIFDNDENIKPRKSGYTKTAIYNGKLYINTPIEQRSENIKNGEKKRLTRLYIDIEDETYFERDDERYYEKYYEEARISSVSFSVMFTDILLEQDRYNKYLNIQPSDWEGMIEVSVYDIYRMPKDNKLYRIFPELRGRIDKLAAQGEKPEIIFMLPDSMTEEELIDMFLPEGEELSFDGVIVDAEHSVDGVPHKINSFDDFKKYMEPITGTYPEFKPIFDVDNN